MGLLVLAHHDMNMKQVADLLRDSAHVRIGTSLNWELHIGGRAVNEALTVAELGLEPLARIDLRRRVP